MASNLYQYGVYNVPWTFFRDSRKDNCQTIAQVWQTLTWFFLISFLFMVIV